MGMISRLIANDAGIIEFQGKSMHDWKSKELAKHLAILTQSLEGFLIQVEGLLIRIKI